MGSPENPGGFIVYMVGADGFTLVAMGRDGKMEEGERRGVVGDRDRVCGDWDRDQVIMDGRVIASCAN